MRRRFVVVAVTCAALAAACWERHAERNDDRAYYFKDGQTYRVEMTGWRFPLVHDPVSFLVERTRETTLTIALPRIDGVIEGSEIPVPPDKLGYVGRVVIREGKMEVDLYYDEPGDGPRRPLSWNDEYTLVQSNSTTRPSTGGGPVKP